MSTVPRPIPDCAAAGGVPGTTVSTVDAGTVSTEFTVVVSTTPLEVADEGVADVAAEGVWLVATDDEVADEIAVELTADDDLVAGELTEAGPLCWLLVDPPVTGPADSDPVGASSAGAAPTAAPGPSSNAAATTKRARKAPIILSRMMFRCGRRASVTPLALEITAAPSGFSIRCCGRSVVLEAMSAIRVSGSTVDRCHPA
jgi:hypothetical protein